MLFVFCENMSKLFTARWRLLINIGMKIDANMHITMTEPKLVGRAMIV